MLFREVPLEVHFLYSKSFIFPSQCEKYFFNVRVQKNFIKQGGALLTVFMILIECFFFFFVCSARGTLGEIHKVAVYYLFMYLLFIYSHVVFFCASCVCSPDFV